MALGAALSAAPTSAASAQSTDSSTFSRGTWGAEFAAGRTFVSLGLLRLLSSSHAIVVDGSSTFGKSTNELDDIDTQLQSHSVNGTVRVGSRWYRPVVPNVRQFATIGILAGGASTRVEANAIGKSDRTDTFIGAFANVGANWFPSRRVSLGAAWEANARYSRAKYDYSAPQVNTPSITVTGLDGTLFLGRMSVALYF